MLRLPNSTIELHMLCHQFLQKRRKVLAWDCMLVRILKAVKIMYIFHQFSCVVEAVIDQLLGGSTFDDHTTQSQGS